MKVTICTVGIGAWYPRGIARMVERFSAVSPGYEIRAHINTLPYGAPENVIEDGYDYTGYCTKPFAIYEARRAGADIVIWLDCAFFPIRAISPLVEHIAQHGYFFCKNGAPVGLWSSDRCLERMGILRTDAMKMEEISSYCVGLNFAKGPCLELLERWAGFAGDRLTVPGHHTNMLNSASGRNPGFVSSDEAVRGHRHDQTVLSILAHQIGLKELTERPKFTAYAGSETDQTVLVNQGM